MQYARQGQIVRLERPRPRSGSQDDLAGRRARGERSMRIGRFREWQLEANADIQRARLDPSHYFVRAIEQLRARRHILVERRSREEERAFAVENLGVERRN